jgi:CDP-glucose 4,6-dehydratase
MEIKSSFWKNRSVFLTGHTGFKGGWITIWLTMMGAKVYGYSLDPPTTPNFFSETKLEERLSSSVIDDIQNFSSLKSAMSLAKPSVIIHMAAQPLVRRSYISPVETLKTNILGTTNLLEAARKIECVEAIVNVTTDKCYENKEQLKPYIESDKLGGYDPYSASKACSELISAAYRNSFFEESGIKIATVRGGNVIGGGDWATDRLIPDFLSAIDASKKLIIRYPDAVRPWQHVLELLSGYLLLAEKLVTDGNRFAGAWNFGPQKNDIKPVSWIVDYLIRKIPNAQYEIDNSTHPHEASLLLLDSSKAKSKLGWSQKLSLEVALDKTIEWHQAWKNNQSMSEFSISQINSYKNIKIDQLIVKNDF